MYKIIQGDCLETLKDLPDGIVQICVTSPPYYGLRDYGTAKWSGGNPECSHKPPASKKGDYPNSDRKQQTNQGSFGYREWRICAKCGAVRIDDQIGLEPTPEAYISKLVEVFREVKRVLKEDGTLWLIIGDSYWGGKGRSAHGDAERHIARLAAGKTINRPYQEIGKMGEILNKDGKHPIIKPKDLIGIPWMVAFALRADGWYLRSDIIWAKPNPMPESVTDRCTKAHEYIFMLSKSKNYFYDSEAIKEPSLEYNWESRYERVTNGHKSNPNEKQNGIRMRNIIGNISGRGVTRTTEGLNLKTQEEKTGPTKNKRDVWTVTTKPYKEAHFATFPPDLIEPCILAGTSEKGECRNCGKAWVRVSERNEIPLSPEAGKQRVMATGGAISGGTERSTLGSGGWGSTTFGWKPQCDCDFSTVPQIVLDPFGGAGTTALVALKHGRDAILCELNPYYIELTKKRLNVVQPKLNGL